MKNNKIKKVSGALLLCGLALTACNGGTAKSNSAITGASIKASSSKSLFSSKNNCLEGLIVANGSGWYTSGSISVQNVCEQDAYLNNTTITFSSEDDSGGFSSWQQGYAYINEADYRLTFSQGSGNTEVGVFTAAKGDKEDSGIIKAGQIIVLVGGVNTTNNGTFNTELANSSIIFNEPTPVSKKGSMTIKVDTSKADCRKNACKAINIKVIANNGDVVGEIKVPESTPIYSQTIESLNPDIYSLSASSVKNSTISFNPSATPNVKANEKTEVSINYIKTVKSGTGVISIPNVLSSYTGELQVKIINVKASEPVVNTYSVKQGSSITIENLPISDATHQYKVLVQGIADPAKTESGYFVESGTPVLKISYGKVTNLAIGFKASPIVTRTVTYKLTGLKKTDTASFTFQDSAGKYAYVPYDNLTGSPVFYIENNTSLGYSIKASSNNYKINPIYNTLLIQKNQTINVQFEPTPPPPDPSGITVAGWPEYLAMGAIGGPNIDPNNAYAGNDGFGGKPIDAVFKYAGERGNGDPGVIDPPMNALRMTKDLTLVSSINAVPSRVVIVEYTGEMSGGKNFSDFTNTNVPDANKQNATYIMARHFASLGADAMALADRPIVYNSKKYYGSLIMNPDLLGAMQQNKYVDDVNNQLPAGAVNLAVDQALCLLTKTRSYTNNDLKSKTDGSDSPTNRKDTYQKTFTGTPYSILIQMLDMGFPTSIISSASDAYWGVGINNKIDDTNNYSQVGTWLNECIAKPDYDKNNYPRPDFKAGFDGWVQANNWLIRIFATKNTVTFGWQDNMWASGSGFWPHQDLTSEQVADKFSNPLISWLKTNAPNTFGGEYAPDFFVFDRYETDDSSSPDQATLYSARSWDNLLTAVGQVSKDFNNIPMMLWQIPGSHIPYVGEQTPELVGDTPESYAFSTAPVYFFGDSNLKPDLSNIIKGPTTSTTSAVGDYVMKLLDPTNITDGYHCPAGACTNYQQYLTYYNGKANNYDWSKDNYKLALAANNHVFAILWGGGNTTNVIKNFSNQNDHGWLANKIKSYYQNPTKLIKK